MGRKELYPLLRATSVPEVLRTKRRRVTLVRMFPVFQEEIMRPPKYIYTMYHLLMSRLYWGCILNCRHMPIVSHQTVYTHMNLCLWGPITTRERHHLLQQTQAFVFWNTPSQLYKGHSHHCESVQDRHWWLLRFKELPGRYNEKIK